MDPEDPKVQLDWIIGTQSLNRTDKKRLETISTNVSRLEKRHEKVSREKQGKILALEHQLLNTTSEKFQQGETMKRLAKENMTLKQDNIKLREVIANMKEDNSQLAFSRKLVGQSAEAINRLEKRVFALEEKVAPKNKQLNSARRLIAHHIQQAESPRRRKRRIAMKLLRCVMALDGDVALP